jgi:hypothetical protein
MACAAQVAGHMAVAAALVVVERTAVVAVAAVAAAVGAAAGQGADSPGRGLRHQQHRMAQASRRGQAFGN